MTPPSDRPGWRWHVGAFAFFLILAVIFIDHGVSLTANILGRGSDPYGFIWFLDWWPWAVTHHLDPFWTNLIWQPNGYAPLWGSSVPLLGLLAAPVTLLAGPVCSFNLLVLLAPVLAAWCAYRLCLRMTQVPSAAIVGGFLFGFSTYQIGQAATLNLSFTFLLPCLVWVVLLRLGREIGRWRFVILASVILPCEFLISTEIFAMTIVFGSIVWLVALVMLREQRPGLVGLLAEGAVAMLITVLLLSPFLVCMFARYPFIHLPELWPYFFVADPLGFVLPSRNNLIGGAYFTGVISGYFGDLQEQDSYLGLPLLLIVYVFARAPGEQLYAKFLTVVFLMLLVASLGPRLWVAGHYSGMGLPWLAFMRLPLLGGALPVRFALYVSLVAAMIVPLWVTARGNQTRRLGLAVIACLALLPRPGHVMRVPDSGFFRPGRVQAVLGMNPRILILPFAINGASSYWQVENRFGFSQTGGYLGFPPAAAQRYPAVQELFSGDAAALRLPDLRDFLAATNTQYVVAGPGTSAGLFAVLAQLRWKMQQTDDVTIYTVSPGH